jgi:hypothetical protein
MMVTVGAWLEALEAGGERLRTLKRLRLPRDAGGEPRMAVRGGVVDFEVEVDGERLTLRCPLASDEATTARLRTAAERDDGLGGRFFTEWRPMEDEAVVFGPGGEACEMDVLARERVEGERLRDFLGRAVVRDDWDAVCRASESFEELARWAVAAGRAVSLKRLVVSAEGEVRVEEFSLADETERIRAMLRAARARMNIGGEHDRAAQAVAASGTMDGPGVGETPGVEDTLGTGAPFGSAACYEEVIWDGEWGVAVVMAEGEWSLLNGAGEVLTGEAYDWLGECSEGLVLAVRGGRCGFVDTLGDEVIPCVWDDATSFSGGVALVTSSGENFFINSRGERI